MHKKEEVALGVKTLAASATSKTARRPTHGERREVELRYSFKKEPREEEPEIDFWTRKPIVKEATPALLKQS